MPVSVETDGCVCAAVAGEVVTASTCFSLRSSKITASVALDRISFSDWLPSPESLPPLRRLLVSHP